MTHEGMEIVLDKGGSKPFLGGVSFVSFSSPIFFPPTMASCDQKLDLPCKQKIGVKKCLVQKSEIGEEGPETLEKQGWKTCG